MKVKSSVALYGRNQRGQGPMLLAPLLLGFVILCSFGIYLATLSPTVNFMDSGELITACVTLGIPHPSGVPVYVLLGKLFSLIPFGNIAYRINLMSAFFAALSVGLLFILAFLLAQKFFQSASICMITAFIGASLFALLHTFWSYAIIAELYTLNAFFFLGLFLILLLWSFRLPMTDDRSPTLLYLFAFVFGLSLTNHLSIVLLFPAFAYFILATLYGRREASGVRRKFFFPLTPYSLLLTALFFLLGLSLYLYLPIRSTMNPLLDWGNPETLKGFFNHITGVQYQHKMSAQPISFENVKYLNSMFVKQFPALLYLFVPIGVYFFWRKERMILLFGIIAIGSYCLPALFSSLSPQAETPAYFFPCFAIICLWIAAGAGFLLSKLLKTRGVLFKTFAFLLALSIPLSTFFTNFLWANKRNYYFAYDYGMNILNSALPRAVIFTTCEYFYFISLYLQNVKKIAPDKTVVCLKAAYSCWYIEQIIRNYPWIYGISPTQIDHYLRDLEEEWPRVRRGEKDFVPEKSLKGCVDLVNTIIGYCLSSSELGHPCYLQIKQAEFPLIKFNKVPQGLVFQVHQDTRFQPINFPELNYRGIREARVERDIPLQQVLHKYWDGWYWRGIYAETNKEYKEAILCHQKALWLNPNFSPARKRLLKLKEQN